MSRLIRSIILLCVCCYINLHAVAQSPHRIFSTSILPDSIFSRQGLPLVNDLRSLNAKAFAQNMLPVQLNGEFFRFNEGSILLTYGNQYAYGSPVSGAAQAGPISHSNAAMNMSLMGVPFSAGYNGAMDVWDNPSDFSLQ